VKRMTFSSNDEKRTGVKLVDKYECLQWRCGMKLADARMFVWVKNLYAMCFRYERSAK